MSPARSRRFDGERFILAEECRDPFDAHDAAHVYRAHEGFRCRVIPGRDAFAIYVGGARCRQEVCCLRWCPHVEDGPARMQFFEPSVRRLPTRRRA